MCRFRVTKIDIFLGQLTDNELSKKEKNLYDVEKP